jgi:hypothetical protein
MDARIVYSLCRSNCPPSEALSAQLMATGGVPKDYALGTFTYALVFRGAQ